MSASMTFTIPGGEEAVKFRELIRKTATAKGVSMSELIVEALAEYLRANNGQ